MIMWWHIWSSRERLLYDKVIPKKCFVFDNIVIWLILGAVGGMILFIGLVGCTTHLLLS